MKAKRAPIVRRQDSPAHHPRARRGANSDPYYIASGATTEATRVLKHGDIFGVLNRSGNFEVDGSNEQGLYFQGTRFLSRLVFSLGEYQPLFLSSTVKDDNALFVVNMTNPDLQLETSRIPRGTLHIERKIFLWQGERFEHLRLRSYCESPFCVAVLYQYAADYVDIFEVRGTPRAKRGRLMRAALDETSATLAYRGLDNVVRETRLRFSIAPDKIDDQAARFDVLLAPGQEISLHLVVSCIIRH